MPLISVIVPCYNQAQYLDDCLQSVLDQTHQDWECIIVNDGSPDNTEEVAKKWLAKDSRFKYLYKENGGLSSARNAGIKDSIGQFIFFLDCDDKISGSGVFEIYHSYLTAYNYDVIIGDVIDRFEDCKKEKSYFSNKVSINTILKDREILPAFSNQIFSVIACAKFYNRNFIMSNEIMFTENIFHEDELFMFHISSVAQRILLVPVFCYEYNRTNNTSITTNITLKNKDDASFVINEHYHLIKKFNLLTRCDASVLNDRIRYLANSILYGNMLLSQKTLWQSYYRNLRNGYMESSLAYSEGCFPQEPGISYFMMKFKFWAEYRNRVWLFKKISSYIKVI